MSYTIISVVCTLLGSLIAYFTFVKNRSAADVKSGKFYGEIIADLSYIKSNTEEIKREQKEQHRINNEIYERLAVVESSAKQAHHRIDHLQEKINF